MISDELKQKIINSYWASKKVTFPNAPQLDSFARGVEEGLFKAIMIINNECEKGE